MASGALLCLGSAIPDSNDSRTIVTNGFNSGDRNDDEWRKPMLRVCENLRVDHSWRMVLRSGMPERRRNMCLPMILMVLA